MTLELQFKLKSNPLYIKYLHENSYWYKILNRNENAYMEFASDMKIKYKLTTIDKINRTIDNIGLIQSFLEVFK